MTTTTLAPSCLALSSLLVATQSLAAQADTTVVPRTDHARAIAVADSGATWQPLPDIRAAIHLRYARFDPLVEGEPAIPAALSAPVGNRLFVVQFVTEVIDEFKQDLRALGAERHAVLPQQAYLVRMDRTIAAQVAARPYVRWVGDYHVAYKLEPAILLALRHAGPRPAMFNVVMVDPRTDREELRARIAAVGGRAQPDSGQSVLQVAALTPRQVLELAAADVVAWIDRASEASVDIDQARIQGGANDIETLGGFNGKGLTGLVLEGVEATHSEFAAIAPFRGAPIAVPPGNATAAAPTEHGTNTAGEIYARGAAPLYRGLAPFAQMLYCNFDYVLNTNLRKAVTQQAVTQFRSMFETASWGYAPTTTYDARSQEMDDIVFDLDVPITQSQGNTGSAMSRPQAWAKNILSVGGCMHRDTANPLDDTPGSASTGPAADGRIKPDFCAYFDAIGTTSSNNGYITGFGGTSGATPIVNGHVGLTAQMFAEGMFGHPAAPSYQQLFAHRAHFATIKALLVNTAYQYDFVQFGGAPLARYRQGWGFPDVKGMYDLREKMLVVDESRILRQGQSRPLLVFVPAATPQLRATMVHADPPATPAVTIHRVNSLDLAVLAPNRTSYLGNNGLLSGRFSTAGGAANDRDTVENVFVQNPSAGVWTVTVTASAVRQDGHVETPVDDVDFALVVSGIGGSRNKTSAVLDLTSTSPGHFGVSVTNLPGGWVTGYTVFSVTTDDIAGNGNWFGVELDGLSLASLQQPTGTVFHFTNTAGVYPRVPFTFPSGLAAALSGITFDAMAVFLDAGGNVVAVANTDRVVLR